MSWIITIDQRTPGGETQRYGPYEEDMAVMSDAVEDAIDQAGLFHVERGEYQITATEVIDA